MRNLILSFSILLSGISFGQKNLNLDPKIEYGMYSSHIFDDGTFIIFDNKREVFFTANFMTAENPKNFDMRYKIYQLDAEEEISEIPFSCPGQNAYAQPVPLSCRPDGEKTRMIIRDVSGNTILFSTDFESEVEEAAFYPKVMFEDILYAQDEYPEMFAKITSGELDEYNFRGSFKICDDGVARMVILSRGEKFRLKEGILYTEDKAQ